jgi:hypothetical protein
VKHLATREKPTEPGWYVWWEQERDTEPYPVLVKARVIDGELYLNFNLDEEEEIWDLPIEVADRLWLKVSD